MAPTTISPSSITPAPIPGEVAIKRLATGAAILVAVASGLLSWVTLTDLAVRSGFPSMLAWALPVSIDGMMLAGSLAVLHATLRGSGTRFPWAVVGLGAGISVWGNVEASAGHGVAAAVLHGFVPVALLLSLESVLRLVRDRLATDVFEREEALQVAREEAAREARRRAQEARAQQEGAVTAAKDSKRVTGAPTRRSRGVDEERVTAIREAADGLPAGLTATSTVRALIREVEGATCAELVRAGVLAQDADTPAQHRKRVENALARARRVHAA